MTYAPQFKDKTIEQLQAMREKCAKRTGVLADPIMLNILDQELLSRALPPDLDQEPHEDTPSLEDSGLSLGSYNS